MLNGLMWKLSRHKHGMSRRALDLAELYVGYYNDFGYDFELNGERFVMDALARHEPKVVFDVGANVGDWSALAAERFARARIHAFELSPDTFRVLDARLAGERFVKNACGLGAADGEIEFKDYGAEHSTLNTITASSYHDARVPFALRRAPLMTGDAYMAQHGIEQIDFLKIDVEGAEHLVLQGFERALADGRITAVQFEYGYANGDAGCLMKDFYRIFRGHGYRVGKIWSKGVRFAEFDYRMNNFDSGPNYLAVREDAGALIETLRSPD